VAAQRRRLGRKIDDAIAACSTIASSSWGRRFARSRPISPTSAAPVMSSPARAAPTRCCSSSWRGDRAGDAVICPASRSRRPRGGGAGRRRSGLCRCHRGYLQSRSGKLPEGSRHRAPAGLTRRRSFRSTCSGNRRPPRHRGHRGRRKSVGARRRRPGFGATYQNRRIARLGWRPRPASFRPSRSAATATAARCHRRR